MHWQLEWLSRGTKDQSQTEVEAEVVIVWVESIREEVTISEAFAWLEIARATYAARAWGKQTHCYLPKRVRN